MSDPSGFDQKRFRSPPNSSRFDKWSYRYLPYLWVLRGPYFSTFLRLRPSGMGSTGLLGNSLYTFDPGQLSSRTWFSILLPPPFHLVGIRNGPPVRSLSSRSICSLHGGPRSVPLIGQGCLLLWMHHHPSSKDHRSERLRISNEYGPINEGDWNRVSRLVL